MKKTIFYFGLLILAAFICTGAAWAQKTNSAGSKAPQKVAVGKVNVNLLGPEGLVRVDGLDSEVDAYIRTVEPKFKLKVLAIYADQAEWKKFTDAVKAKKPASIPHYAMICVTNKMHRKSYNSQAARKEFKKYENWFSLASNNRPMAALLTTKGNAKLKEYMGVDIGFKFKVGKQTKKVAAASNSLTLGAEVSFNVFGKPSNVYLTATSLQVADKLVFLAYFENVGSGSAIEEIQAKSVLWRGEMSSANAGR